MCGMLIDRNGRVTRVNHRAEGLFCKDFGIRNGRLWTRRKCQPGAA